MSLQVFADLKERLRSLPIEDFIREVVEDNKEELADMNIAQLELGQDSEGELIRPELRNPGYAKMKKYKGGKAPLGTPDMKDTGSLYNKTNAEVRGNKIYFGSTDSKAPKLIKKYGKLFGVQDEGQEQFSQETLKDELIEKTRNYVTK